MQHLPNLIQEVDAANYTPDQRYPILCEIVKKTEHLQVRALAVLYADRLWVEEHGTWTSFCRSSFGWDDSYASRMKKAAEMVLSGTPVSTEAQARALSSVPSEKRNEVLEKAREEKGSEPSASDIRSVVEKFGPDAINAESDMQDAQDDIDSCIADLRAVLKRIKSLPSKKSGRWINMPHLIADIKNAAEALKHARPHGKCDEWGNHSEDCLCGGTKWLPKHVLERPKEGGKA
jgi:glycerol-3-phosphate cytidylyltransferase-like family protein